MAYHMASYESADNSVKVFPDVWPGKLSKAFHALKFQHPEYSDEDAANVLISKIGDILAKNQISIDEILA